MIAKPVKALELHYPMIQFLEIYFIFSGYFDIFFLWLQHVKMPDAYERLIMDVISGNQSHFVRRWLVFSRELIFLARELPELLYMDVGSLGSYLYSV